MKYKVLVNKENKIKDNFLSKIELIITKDVDGEEIQVEKETYNAYLELKKFLETKNVIIGISSAYRSKVKGYFKFNKQQFPLLSHSFPYQFQRLSIRACLPPAATRSNTESTDQTPVVCLLLRGERGIRGGSESFR